MDMANAYSSWIEKHFPKTRIVFDHFYMIKLRRWATTAEATDARELVSMAKTIREKLHGIITYWIFDGLSNASTEGFNNKI